MNYTTITTDQSGPKLPFIACPHHSRALDFFPLQTKISKFATRQQGRRQPQSRAHHPAVRSSSLGPSVEGTPLWCDCRTRLGHDHTKENLSFRSSVPSLSLLMYVQEADILKTLIGSISHRARRNSHTPHTPRRSNRINSDQTSPQMHHIPPPSQTRSAQYWERL